MPAILNNATTTLNPLAMSEYTADQDGGAIVHRILGRREPDVTFRPAELRAGMFTIDFPSEASASAAREALGGSGAWTLAHSERPSVNMRFVVRRLSFPISDAGRWMLTVSYEEIGA